MIAGASARRTGAAASLLRVVAYLGRTPVRTGLTVGLLLVNICIELWLPQVIGDMMTRLGARQPGASVQPILVRAVGLYLGLTLIRTIVGLRLGPLRNRTAQAALSALRGDVYDALQRQTFAWHDNARAGELISRASTDVWRVQDFIFVCLLFAVDAAAGMLGAVVLVFRLNLRLGCVILGALGPSAAAMAFFALRVQPRWRRAQDRQSAMTTVLQENIAGARVVRAFAREGTEVAKYEKRKRDYVEEYLGAARYWAVRAPLAQLLFGLAAPVALWVGGGQVVAGRMALGDLAKAILYIFGLTNRIGLVGQIATLVQNAASSAQRVREILDAPVSMIPGRDPLPAGRGAIRFEEVRFAFSREPALPTEPLANPPSAPTTVAERRPALDGVSFEIAAGETVGIAGATGAGKSTLLALVARFYDPTSGRVTLDGADVRRIDPAALRQAVAVVFQDTFLFTATIAENIAFGRPDARRADVVEAARAARADGFIQKLDQGYDTVIGERGVSLSGGQRQRLAIARALILDPRVILLDDATSAVDSATEREIQEAIAEICRGRTTLIVAQRLSTLRRTSRVLVLERGRIVQSGPPAELEATPGPYRTLFASQWSAAA